MLTREYVTDLIHGHVAGFPALEAGEVSSQVIEAEGLDAILELLRNLRTVSFPCVVLEGRSSGSLQLVEGPLDTYTESLWVMCQFGREESEAACYDAAFRIMVAILKHLIADSAHCPAALVGWDWTRTNYMKRYGGQNARGWEMVLTFRENVSLLID